MNDVKSIITDIDDGVVYVECVVGEKYIQRQFPSSRLAPDFLKIDHPLIITLDNRLSKVLKVIDGQGLVDINIFRNQIRSDDLLESPIFTVEKEESQEELWDEVINVTVVLDSRQNRIQSLKTLFTITRKGIV